MNAQFGGDAAEPAPACLCNRLHVVQRTAVPSSDTIAALTLNVFRIRCTGKQQVHPIMSCYINYIM